MRVSRALFFLCAFTAGASNVGRAQMPTERVTGIGGIFFRAKDPKGLAEWYQRNLGVTQTPTDYGMEPWKQDAGPTVFGPFKEETKYFGKMTQQWMINFRVRDLDAMVAQLQRAGVVVKVDSQAYPNGRFARLEDPEGNPIELWEPKDPRASRD